MVVNWLTAFIAAIVAFITFLQWVTAREKIVLDLFDKRFEVYEELRSAVAKFDQDHYFKFTRAVSRSKFLFGSEVTSFLEERRQDFARVVVEFANPRELSEPARKLWEDQMVAHMERLNKFYLDLDACVLPYMHHTQKKLDWAIYLRRFVDKMGVSK